MFHAPTLSDPIVHLVNMQIVIGSFIAPTRSNGPRAKSNSDRIDFEPRCADSLSFHRCDLRCPVAFRVPSEIATRRHIDTRARRPYRSSPQPAGLQVLLEFN